MVVLYITNAYSRCGDVAGNLYALLLQLLVWLLLNCQPQLLAWNGTPAMWWLSSSNNVLLSPTDEPWLCS
jgi:hypothetical protein